MMIRIGMLAVAIALVTAAPAHSAAKVARPASVIAVVSRSAPSAFDALRAFVKAVAPNATQVSDEVILSLLAAGIDGSLKLDGLDLSKPIYVIYADDGTNKGIAVVAHVADAKALNAGLNADGIFDPNAPAPQIRVQDGWTAIATKPVLALVGDYALSALVTTAPPSGIAATIYIQAVLERYQGPIAMARIAMTQMPGGTQMTQLMTNYFDGIMSVAQDASEIRVSIDANADHVGMDAAFVPKARSRLATFVALQHPSDFGLLAKLPADPAPILIAGHATLGPYRDGFMDVMAQMYGAANADMIHVLDAIMQTTTGDIAMAVSMANGMKLTQAFGLADVKAANTSIARLLKLIDGVSIEMAGSKFTYSVSPEIAGHDGVTLHPLQTKIDTSKLAAANKAVMDKMMPHAELNMTISTFDKIGLATTGLDAIDQANRAIDSLHGKGKRFVPPADLARLLDKSRKRKDSLVFVMDILGLIGKPSSGSGIVMAMGFADSLAHLHIDVPVGVAHGLVP